MSQSAGRAWWGVLFAGMVLAWGLNYLFVRWGLADAPALWLAALRTGVGGLVLAPLVGRLRDGPPLDSAGRRDAFLIGIPNSGVFFGLWFLAASSVPPGQSAVLVYTFPLWVALLSWSLIRTPLRTAQVVAIGLGFLGVVLVSQPWADAAPPPTAVAELLLGSVSWAVGTVLMKRRFPGADLAEANFYQLLGGTAILLVGATVLEPEGFAPSLRLLAIVFWLGVVGTAFAYTVWFGLLVRSPAPTLSSYVFLVPVVALGASLAITGESLQTVQLLGVIAVLVAAFLTARLAPRNDSGRPEGAGVSPPARFS